MAKSKGDQPAPNGALKVFISHAHANAGLADAVADLLQRALKLDADEIRASSALAYKYQPGTEFGSAIPHEIKTVKAFIGLLTRASLNSSYVLFELGARWGANLPSIPLLAIDAEIQDLPGPLQGLVAADARKTDSLFQFVETVGKRLSIIPGRTSNYFKLLEKVQLEATRSGQRDAVEVASVPAVISETTTPNVMSRLIQVLARFDSPDEDFYVSPNISARIRQNARARLKLAGRGELLAIIDNSYNGVNGLAIVGKGLAWRNDQWSEPGFIDWPTFAKLKVRASDYEDTLYLGDRYEIDFSGSNAYPSDVGRALREIRKVLAASQID